MNLEDDYQMNFDRYCERTAKIQVDQTLQIAMIQHGIEEVKYQIRSLKQNNRISKEYDLINSKRYVCDTPRSRLQTSGHSNKNQNNTFGDTRTFGSVSSVINCLTTKFLYNILISPDMDDENNPISSFDQKQYISSQKSKQKFQIHKSAPQIAYPKLQESQLYFTKKNSQESILVHRKKKHLFNYSQFQEKKNSKLQLHSNSSSDQDKNYYSYQNNQTNANTPVGIPQLSERDINRHEIIQLRSQIFNLSEQNKVLEQIVSNKIEIPDPHVNNDNELKLIALLQFYESRTQKLNEDNKILQEIIEDIQSKSNDAHLQDLIQNVL